MEDSRKVAQGRQGHRGQKCPACMCVCMYMSVHPASACSVCRVRIWGVLLGGFHKSPWSFPQSFKDGGKEK